MSPVLIAAADLSRAFADRDVAAAMGCFVAGDDISYTGSEHDESAAGREGVAVLLSEIFARAEAYSWRVGAATVREYGDCAYLFGEADGRVRGDDGSVGEFAYRISGLLEPVGGRWLWRHCHGCEPSGR